MDCKTAQQKIMPYIEHKLSDRETEDFIEHIRGCEACSEELEVYFTIYYALEQLDYENHDTYNMKELLNRDLDRRERKVRSHGIVTFYRRLAMTVFGILIAIFIVTAVQTVLYGSIEKTTIYGLFGNESEAPPQTQKETDAPLSDKEETERETNRKRQPIVTTPETEARQTETKSS